MKKVLNTNKSLQALSNELSAAESAIQLSINRLQESAEKVASIEHDAQNKAKFQVCSLAQLQQKAKGAKHIVINSQKDAVSEEKTASCSGDENLVVFKKRSNKDL